MPTALQFEQPDRGQFVGDENIEESTVQRTQNRRGLVQPAGHTDHLGDVRQIAQLDSDAAVVDGQVNDVAVGVPTPTSAYSASRACFRTC